MTGNNLVLHKALVPAMSVGHGLPKNKSANKNDIYTRHCDCTDCAVTQMFCININLLTKPLASKMYDTAFDNDIGHCLSIFLLYDINDLYTVYIYKPGVECDLHDSRLLQKT